MKRLAGLVVLSLLLAGCAEGGIDTGEDLKRQSIGSYKKQGSEKPKSSGKQAEPAPAKAQKDCKFQDSPRAVLLNRGKYPETAFHVQEAIKMGAPEVLVIERTGTEEKRDAWARVVGKQPNLKERGLDQDEYPMAMSSDRLGAGREANIALIDSSDNRGAGSSVGSQLRGWCDGQKFKLKPYGKYPRKVTITIIANNGRRMNKTVSSP